MLNTPCLQSSQRGKEEQEKILAEFELRRKVRATVVPTDDGKVREMLRQLEEPITLFGEREVGVAAGQLAVQEIVMAANIEFVYGKLKI